MCILTPYKAQCDLLNRLLFDPLEVLGMAGLSGDAWEKTLRFLKERRTGGTRVYIRLAVVDAMQGATDDIVILSLTRDGFGTPGFLAVWARVYVATTRACGLLVILGHHRLLQQRAPRTAALEEEPPSRTRI